ncbi:Xylanolytic transcriptional activator xlnR [Taphrina deformans PYCC 5710]|uniref:Xylanolytic transcriptional activator xlnR n=1 Tax=Taphrina deformans (strain PYCC 5710 / ATCC 11124 / CBS 356.35 / IMI 108563 / JCM 9778 / NBRC 8474) TaxID=1097556 RepID=R4XCQ8_TAPDE|nr:Xylanolytic transcriptional activator xlnR [Taphrina deformans PYCC 5710]|eukprot:CCG82171.1 Xylanolytic transcriptional activator xlnR [Taphrina deformans PYCC 5710]
MSDVRKRISRACDSCNALRTKCDGHQPCRHCVEIGVACQFNRVRKKRGKAAKKDVDALSETGSQQYRSASDRSVLGHTSLPATLLPGLQQQNTSYASKAPAAQEWANNLPSPGVLPFESPQNNGHPYHPTGQTPSPMGMSFANLPPNGPLNTNISRYSQNSLTRFPAGPGPHLDHPFNLPPPISRPMSITGSEMNNLNSLFGPTAQSPRHELGQSPRFNSGPDIFQRPSTSVASDDRQLKYPILAQHTRALEFIPGHVLCDLLDTYFDNSPYVFGYVVRRCSILHKLHPRKTSTSLIYAMLCVAAHTCEHSFFSSSPVARAKTVQRLFEMSVSALRPLQHDQVNGGALDDVITYIQLGAIIAASEFKGVSLRWFHAAWTLAKELHLNRELPDTSEGLTTTETTKEERRRTWWLLYIVDRHLCLCYNKPLVFSDVECIHLFHPMCEDRWNSDEEIDMLHDNRSVNSRSSYSFDASRHPLYQGRARGPAFEIQGRGIFGFFLPLMVILGEICTLVMMKRTYFIAFDNLDYAKQQIQQHLARYERSLDGYRGERLSGQTDMLQFPRRFPETAFLPYARQLMHTMYILLCGKWDPILLMEDEDQWISTKEFVAAATHAVAAAEATTDILRIDPDLGFMPFFFGIYLLQGSFLLLLIVDKLEQSADEAVIQAAETYIRAHEVCVVTLDTQYQRNFRKVMRSTLNSIRQRRRSSDEEKSRRREILALYRWHEDGRGLVI